MEGEVNTNSCACAVCVNSTKGDQGPTTSVGRAAGGREQEGEEGGIIPDGRGVGWSRSKIQPLRDSILKVIWYLLCNKSE